MPDRALLKLETRGENTEINQYMEKEARRMLEAAALLYDCQVDISVAGSAPACVADLELGKEIAALAEASGVYKEIIPFADMGGSEDCTYFIERVQKQGGRAVYLGYGTNIAAGHHNDHFDFNENCLWQAVGLLTTLVKTYTNK